MSYTPSYSPTDIAPITIDVVAKGFITVGTIIVLVIIALLIIWIKKRR